jgi:drug/metabolite transporter (DMT)-like permease
MAGRVEGEWRGWLAAAAAALLFGVTVPLSEPLLDRSGPVVLAGLLYLGAAVAVAPVAVRGGGWVLRRRDAARLGGAVLLGGAIAPVLVLLALERAPAPTVSLLLNLEVVATAVLAVLVFRDHLVRRAWVGVALVVAACVVLTGGGTPELRVAGLLVLLATLAWGTDNNLTATLDAVAPARITFVKGAVAGSVNLALGLALGQGLPGGDGTAAALALGALGYGVSITLWISGARVIGAARAQAVFATGPFWGVATGWMLGDPVVGRQVLAAGLAAFGVALTLGTAHQHRHRHLATVHVHTHGHADPHHTGHGALDERHRHEHSHPAVEHEHKHLPDVHHRHEHP